jgi:NADPH-dependent 2,4-dienoyl-CoA reductase/sulfur reductase-like enzyme
VKIVVVGGVAAGASVAARARRLDEHAEIVVLERGHHVSFANCGLPYHIGEVITDRSRLLLQTPQSLRDMLDIDVRTGSEVLAIDTAARSVRVREVDTGREYDEGYDALALCPGAEPVRPPLPGVAASATWTRSRPGSTRSSPPTREASAARCAPSSSAPATSAWRWPRTSTTAVRR